MFDSLAGKEAYGYLRISNDLEGKKLGVDRQRDDILALAKQLGVTIVRFFCDNDISASTNSDEDRPDYEEMLSLLKTGPVKIVLSYTKSRLTRDPSENERQISLARKHQVQYYYVRGAALDLQVSANRKMDRIQAAMDAGVAEDIQELTLRKKQEDAREGKAGGGSRAYGYGKVVGYNPLTGKDICDPYQVREDEVAVLKEGKRRTLAGDNQFTIMQDWKRRGIKTSKGHNWRVGPFKRTLLSERYVQFDPTGHPADCKCLLNPPTGGTRIHHEDRHRAKWPYVFTKAEHESMVAIFNSRQKYWSNVGKLKGRTYLLSDVLECGGTWPEGTAREGQPCKGSMFGQGKTEDGKYIRRYACKKWDNTGTQIGCCTVFRIADAVEYLVSEQVLYRFDSPDIAKALAPATNEGDMAKVIQELAELRARRDELAAEYAAGEHEKNDYRVMLDVIKQKQAKAEEAKKKLLHVEARNLAVPTDGGLREMWKTASLAWRASVVKLVVEKVIIHPGHPGGRMWPDKNGWRFNPELVEIVWLH